MPGISMCEFTFSISDSPDFFSCDTLQSTTPIFKDHVLWKLSIEIYHHGLGMMNSCKYVFYTFFFQELSEFMSGLSFSYMSFFSSSDLSFPFCPTFNYSISLIEGHIDSRAARL